MNFQNIGTITWQCLNFLIEEEETVKNPLLPFLQNAELYLCDMTKYFIPKLTKEDI